MNESYNAVKRLVIDKLNLITKANGYHNDATILEGWLTFYATDLVQGKDGKTFPAISVHYGSDAVSKNGGSIDNQSTRTLKITGAVTTDSPEQVNEKLDELYKDIKVALGVERKLTIVGADFMLPEGNLPYAMFDMTITISINEKWEN